jgi:CHAD domain-containing protein
MLTLMTTTQPLSSVPTPAPVTRRGKRLASVYLKPREITLSADASVDAAIAGVLAGARDHWLVNEAAAREGRDIEGVHQVRVGLRRLRSGLALFKKFLPDSQRDLLNEEARWLLGELGQARDLDVFAVELMPAAGASERGPLSRAVSAARRLAHARARTALSSARAKRFQARLETWLDGSGWRTGEAKDARAVPVREFAVRALNKRLVKILAHGKTIDRLPIAELHELRIAVKKVRYGVEFFHAVLPKRRAIKLAAALKDLQDSLGRLNDLDVAEQIVGQFTDAAKSTKAGHAIAAAGAAVVAHHRQAAEDAVTGIAPRWRKVRSVGLL